MWWGIAFAAVFALAHIVAICICSANGRDNDPS